MESEYRKGYVYIQNHFSGIIAETEEGYIFTYDQDYLDKEDAVAVSLTLPLRQEPGSRNFQLSKAYDMLPVNVIMPEDKEQLALTINGKKRNIHKKEFRILAESCGIPLNSAERMMKKVCSLKAKLFTQIEESCLSAEQKEQMEELISKRLDILS